MSLPLTRRIAQAALLVAAGAAPVVAAGAASAAELPKTADLGGLTQLDSDALASKGQAVVHQVGQETGRTGGSAVYSGIPAAADTVGSALGTAVPETNQLVGSTAEQLNTTADRTRGLASDTAQRAAVPAAEAQRLAPLGRSAGLPGLPGLPGGGLGALPVNQLPLDQLSSGPQNRLGGMPDLGSTTGTVQGLAGNAQLPLGNPGLPL